MFTQFRQLNSFDEKVREKKNLIYFLNLSEKYKINEKLYESARNEMYKQTF